MGPSINDVNKIVVVWKSLTIFDKGEGILLLNDIKSVIYYYKNLNFNVDL